MEQRLFEQYSLHCKIWSWLQWPPRKTTQNKKYEYAEIGLSLLSLSVEIFTLVLEEVCKHQAPEATGQGTHLDSDASEAAW